MKTDQKEIKIWEGIYKNFADTGIKNDVFNEDLWTANSLRKLRDIFKEENNFYSTYPNQDELLPFLVATLSSKKETLKILDFGGGMGITYAQLLKSVPNKNISYFIVEKDTVCKAGSKFFKNDKRVEFTNSMPKIKKVDIVYIRSSLQYIDDWKKLLRTLASYKPRFFLFVDLFAGNIPSYVTTQNYYGGKIPCRFLNRKEVVGTMKNLDFNMMFEAPYASAFFGKLNNFPQSNFPKKYRIGKSKNILFFNKNN